MQGGTQSSGVSSVAGRIGAIVLGESDITGLTADLAARGFRAISPKDAPYNAAGDGIADDGPALRSWWAALEATPRVVGFIPPGTYLCSLDVNKNIISATKGCRVYTAGRDTVTIKLKDAVGNYNGIICGASNDLTGLLIEEITFDQNSGNNLVTVITDLTNPNQARFAIQAYVGTRMTVRGCRFTNFDSINAITFNGAALADCVIENNVFDGVGGTVSHDHSTIYVAGYRNTVRGNRMYGSLAKKASCITGIEVHGGGNQVYENTVSVYQLVGNCCGDIAGSSQNYWHHNIGINVGGPIQIWSNTPSGLTESDISDNDITIDYDNWHTQSVQTNFISLDPNGTAPLRNVTIARNKLKLTNFIIRSGAAQGGGASTITLDAGASAVDGFYNGRYVKIDSGPGAGQAKLITGYVGATKVATVSGTFSPVATSASVFLVTVAPTSSDSLSAAITLRRLSGLTDTNVRIIDNEIDGCVAAGIYLSLGTENSITIRGNRFRNVAQGGPSGVFASAYCVGMLLIGTVNDCRVEFNEFNDDQGTHTIQGSVDVTLLTAATNARACYNIVRTADAANIAPFSPAVSSACAFYIEDVVQVWPGFFFPVKAGSRVTEASTGLVRYQTGVPTGTTWDSTGPVGGAGKTLPPVQGLNVKNSPYNAKGDAVKVSDALMTNGSPNVTSATANFSTARDQGKSFSVANVVGGVLQTLTTTISSVTNSTTAVLAANWTFATTSATLTATFGTDDSVAIRSWALDLYTSPGAVGYLPPGTYMQRPDAGGYGLLLSQGPRIVGAGRERTTLLMASGVGNYNAMLSGFTSDMSGLQVEGVKFDQNSQGNPLTALTDLTTPSHPRYAIEVFLGSRITIRDCWFTNIDNTNTITLNGTNVFDSLVCDNLFDNTGGSVTHDHSTIYSAGTRIVLRTNTFLGNTANRGSTVTALEPHGDATHLYGNTVYNYQLGANVAGIGMTQVEARHNIFRNVGIGFQLWDQTPGTPPALQDVLLIDNEIVIDYANWHPYLAQVSGVLLNNSSNVGLRNVQIRHNIIRLVNPPVTYNISSIVNAGTLATATTTVAHGYPIGVPQTANIAGASQALNNGLQTITATTTTAFTYTMSGTPGGNSTTATVTAVGASDAVGAAVSFYRTAGQTDTNITIADNEIDGSIAAGVYINCGTINGMTVSRNKIRNVGLGYPSGAFAAAYSCAVLLAGTLNDVKVNDNQVVDDQAAHTIQSVIDSSLVAAVTNAEALDNTFRAADGIAWQPFVAAAGAGRAFFVRYSVPAYIASTSPVMAGSQITETNTGIIRWQVATPSGAVFISPMNDRESYLVNGGMDYAQRQVPTTLTSYAATANRVRAFDRWSLSIQTSSLQAQQVDTSTTPETNLLARNYCKLKQITGAGKFMLSQVIEGINSMPMRGRTIRFQCKMKYSVAASMTVRLGLIANGNAATIDVIVNPWTTAWGAVTVDPTLGANLTYVTPVSAENGTISGGGVTCVLTAAWVRYSATFVVPTNCKNLIPVVWSHNQLAINDELNISECDLHNGTEFNDWTPRPTNLEFTRCQRYYCKTFPLLTAPAQTGGVAGALRGSVAIAGAVATSSVMQWQFPGQMRAAPTLTFYNPSAANAFVRNVPAATDATVTAAANATADAVDINATGLAAWTAGQEIKVHATADAEI